VGSDTWKVLAATHLLASGAGFALAPREMLETEVRHSGFFRTDTKRVLSAAVESLRSENRLLVYSYRGSAAVSVERDGLLLDGRQDLIVPAAVNYYVDVSILGGDRVRYDERSRTITVVLPKLTIGDVAFEPEGSRVANAGLLTFSQRQVEDFSRLNYASARRAFLKMSQQRSLVNAAQTEAIRNIERYFEIPLRAAGLHDVRVVATFDGGPTPPGEILKS
jgi:hypothetical protein